MANNLPQMQAIQLKMTEARQTGNALMGMYFSYDFFYEFWIIFPNLAAKYSQDLMIFMKEKDISPFKNLLVPLAMVSL
jgi:hypothetical protein